MELTVPRSPESVPIPSSSEAAASIDVGGGHVLSTHQAGSGSPILLLHGFPGSAMAWRSVMARLAVDHRVIAPDLLGFGGSSKPRRAADLWVNQQATAVAEVLRQLGVTRVAVVGHDFGGPVAVALVARHPDLVSHLVLSATNVFPDTPIPMPVRAVTWPVVGRMVERLLFSRRGLASVLTSAVGRPVVVLDPTTYLGGDQQVRATRVIFAWSLRNLAALYESMPSVLDSVRVPSLVIWGTRDPFFPVAVADRTAAAIPGGRLAILEDAGHFLPEERPDEFADLVADLVGDYRRVKRSM